MGSTVTKIEEKSNYSLPNNFYPLTLQKEAEREETKESTIDTALPPLPVSEIPLSVDSADINTPDNWVKRDERLVRLTGKHPFNCEAKLDTLFKAGFLTPTSLFYVRNHGAVPRVDRDKAAAWTLRIHGLVQNECKLTIRELAQLFPVVTLPITLVCAGNRRKEQNVVRKGLGFNWGAAGVSTALFTGVYLADIIDHVKPIRGKAKHVIFEGTDVLPNGPYGTSQKLSKAHNKENGMLIAWAMNGAPLEPDHGFPLRLVVPGQIGGRSVKWLDRIEISDQESQHYLHFWDNKVLPTQVLPEQARTEKQWWYDPRYIITDLNVNSAIAQPDHDERLTIRNTEDAYLVKGYTYAGGGRRVTKVEISLDEGSSWTLAEIVYPEDLYRAVCHSDPIYGTLDLTDRETSFCWCFWSYQLKVADLVESKAIMVRAMDEGMCVQQSQMYWNATGMMNNWYFRIAITKETIEGRECLHFEHPTMAGVVPGGWMERFKTTGQDILNPSFGSQSTPSSFTKEEASAKPNDDPNEMINPAISRKITRTELEAQDREKPWFVVKGQVYDGTPFLEEHPGGPDSIILVAGEDATDDFMAIHSPDAKAKMRKYHIGALVEDGSGQTKPSEEPTDDPNAPFLHKSTWKTVTLIRVSGISPDSKIFRFSLDNPDRALGLPVGQHVFVRLTRKNGETVQRAYTPVSLQNTQGTIDFLIKIYFPSSEFPDGGKMTMGFHELAVGDTIQIKGPIGSFIWEGNGVASWRGVKRTARNLGLICAGSGITPILQVLRAVLTDEEDRETRLWLLDSNRTEQDILCREELDTLYLRHGQSQYLHEASITEGDTENQRLLVHHTLSKPSAAETWAFSIGRINDEMLRKHLPSPDTPDALLLICGPDRLIKETVQPGLQRLGWDTSKTLVIF